MAIWPMILRMTRLLSLASLLACAAAAALIAGWLLARARPSVSQSEALADAQLWAGLLSSEIARLRLLPMALGEIAMWQPLTSGDSAAQDRLNRKLERVAHDAGAAVIYGAAMVWRCGQHRRDPPAFVNKN
jgi:two-component system C4-dicarboxylate transport sensor histidine kinase DctB